MLGGIVLALILILLSELFLLMSHKKNIVGVRKFEKNKNLIYASMLTLGLLLNYLYKKLEKVSCKEGYVCYCVKRI